MLFLRLWNYMRGYVIILVEGYFLEKFINICTHRQIFLWDVKRQKNCKMMLKISIKGFKMLRPIARKTRCRVSLVGKRGFPFVMYRYKNRKTFVVGAVAFIFMIFILSSYIWAVDISGNKKISSQLIVDKLAAYGVRPGTIKYGIDTNKLVNNMMLEINELAWIGITVKGTKIKVEVAERTNPPELVKKDIPCDIIATKDGVIKSIITKEGQEAVKVGDTITRGQILISGSVVNAKKPEVPPRLVHAIGLVKARTWYEGSCAVDQRPIEKQRTGKIQNKYSLVLFSKNINLLPGRVKFENYDRSEIRKRLSVGEDLVFPFEFVIDKYYESNLVEKEISYEEARQHAADNAYKEALKNVPEGAEIVKSSVEYVEKDDEGTYANVVIECLENIGIQQQIGGK
ncbi:MAG: sporulation protein YqfD [Clostridia bacterium]|nr:sporulation protein YqfD [Clostridia bacterium]